MKRLKTHTGKARQRASLVCVVLLCVGAFTCSHAPKTPSDAIMDPQSVTFSAAQTQAYLPTLERCGGSRLEGATGSWTPPRRVTGRLDMQIRRTLQGSLVSDSVLNAKDYLFQYFGVVVHEQRMVFINGLHEIVVTSFVGEKDAWKQEPVVVCDVGKAGFQADFDVQSLVLSPLRFDPGY